MMSFTRVRNRILQALYRPKSRQNRIFTVPAQTLTIFDEWENSIEEKITPLLSEFFD
ncbi:MAG: hypothetical protein FWF81_02540 [Defluviitaleaceae bacterium]|nr:hypothetical protein [Defluviitaleaceae bacterium]